MTDLTASRRTTAPAVSAAKGGDTPLVMVTAYDAPSARWRAPARARSSLPTCRG